MPPAERRPRPRPALDRPRSTGDEDVAAPPRADPAGARATGAGSGAAGGTAPGQDAAAPTGTAPPTGAAPADAVPPAGGASPSGTASPSDTAPSADTAPAGATGPARARPQQRTPAQRQPRSAQGHGGQPHGGHRSPGRTVEETSAGGLVVRRVDGVPQVAVIARINRGGRLEWCLPKGHLEGVETAEEAAVREIAEETGIEGRVLRALGSIDYWFSVEGRRIHKTVHHYLLEATGGTLGVEGDPDAEAVDAAWVPVAELPERLAFSNERRIARMAGSVLAEGA